MGTPTDKDLEKPPRSLTTGKVPGVYQAQPTPCPLREARQPSTISQMGKLKELVRCLLVRRLISMEPKVSASESHALHLYGFLGSFCFLFLSSGQEFAFSFMSCQLLGAGCGHILPLTQGRELSVDPCSSAPGPFLTQAHLSRRLF